MVQSARSAAGRGVVAAGGGHGAALGPHGQLGLGSGQGSGLEQGVGM